MLAVLLLLLLLNNPPTVGGATDEVMLKQLLAAPHELAFWRNNPLGFDSATGAYIQLDDEKNLADKIEAARRIKLGSGSNPDLSFPPGLYLSGAFTDYVVLQREPSAAKIYGILWPQTQGPTAAVKKSHRGAGQPPPPPPPTGPSCGTWANKFNGTCRAALVGKTITITITDTQAHANDHHHLLLGRADNSYTVTATVDPDTGMWGAMLKPAPAGGNYNVQASVTGAANTTSDPIVHNATFGDIYVCSGITIQWCPLLGACAFRVMLIHMWFEIHNH
eukprot:SAG11_NODE_4883_length_1735_cov_1.166259_1_plen_277_part_00